MRVEKKVCAVSHFARADPQQSCCADRKTTVSRMPAGGGDVTELAGEVFILVLQH